MQYDFLKDSCLFDLGEIFEVDYDGLHWVFFHVELIESASGSLQHWSSAVGFFCCN